MLAAPDVPGDAAPATRGAEAAVAGGGATNWRQAP
jgi:hypothetical protein